MPKLEYFLVCESTSVDRTTNRLSLFNIIEAMSVVKDGQPGYRIAQLFAVSCWLKQEGDEGREFQSLLRIRAPCGGQAELTMNFHMEKERQRLLSQIAIPPLSVDGDLVFELLLNSKHAATHTVAIRTSQQPAEQ